LLKTDIKERIKKRAKYKKLILMKKWQFSKKNQQLIFLNQQR